MLSVKLALALAAASIALAAGLTLAGSPLSVLATNGISAASELANTQRATSACQPGETVPAGASAVRITLGAEAGPRTTVAVKANNGRTIARGVRGAGWTGASVTVAIRHLSRTVANAQVCFGLARPIEQIKVFGQHSRRAVALAGPRGEKLPGRIGVEYLRPARSSWLSLIPSVARHMGFGHAWGGAWIVFALLVAMILAGGLVGWLAVRDLRPQERP